MGLVRSWDARIQWSTMSCLLRAVSCCSRTASCLTKDANLLRTDSYWGQLSTVQEAHAILEASRQGVGLSQQQLFDYSKLIHRT